MMTTWTLNVIFFTVPQGDYDLVNTLYNLMNYYAEMQDQEAADVST